MKPLVLIMVPTIMLITLHCSRSYKMTGSEKNKNPATEVTPVFDVSARTKLFLQALNRELAAHGGGLDSYTPSEELIGKYALDARGDAYHISGLMKYNDELSISDLMIAGVIMVAMAGEFTTVNVPVNALQYFFQARGITSFQISEKKQSR